MKAIYSRIIFTSSRIKAASAIKSLQNLKKDQNFPSHGPVMGWGGCKACFQSAENVTHMIGFISV